MEEILCGPPKANSQAQDVLLEEVERVFTQEDNDLLLKPPTKEELWRNLNLCNLHAAPGSDGLTSFLFKECWDVFGDHLTEMVIKVSYHDVILQQSHGSWALISHLIRGSSPF